MPGTEQSENPYLPPATDNDHFGSSRRSFQVGLDELSTVSVETSLWTGLKTYSTNDRGISTPVHRGACRFEVGERERHQVEIRVDGTGRVNAFVDGELIIKNLFPKMRLLILSLVALFCALTFGIVSLGILGIDSLMTWIF